MYYVYILQSEKDKRYYIGQTKDIKKRFARHMKGEVISTRNRRPLKIVYSEECSSRREAMNREKYIKSLK